MNDIFADIALLKEHIDQQIKHPYLMRFIDVPVVDEDKLIFLYTILKESEQSCESLTKYILPTMLVQIALDTHEKVTVSSHKDSDEMLKNRQLTVLAGDYYSGLYYYLLAKIDDIEMVELLASAIKDINEYKIMLYQNDINDTEHLISSMKKVDSLLIQRLAVGHDVPHLKELASDVCFLTRLKSEKVNWLENKRSTFINALLTQIQSVLPEKQVENRLDQMINDTILKIEKTLQQHALNINNMLSKYIKHILLGDGRITLKNAAEEG